MSCLVGAKDFLSLRENQGRKIFRPYVKGEIPMKEVVIVSACRTAVGDFAGSLSTFSATDLGALVIREALNRAGVEHKDVDEVIMGSVLPHGLGQNPARQSMVRAGFAMGCGRHYHQQGLRFGSQSGDAGGSGGDVR